MTRAMDRYVPLPPLPARISRLNELAYNLWWSWNARSARGVPRSRLSALAVHRRTIPVLLLHLVEPERLEHRRRGSRVPAALRRAPSPRSTPCAPATGTWWSASGARRGRRRSPGSRRSSRCTNRCRSTSTLAAWSPGTLAKEASDLGVPLVGVGLMYPRGYAHQRLSAEGGSRRRYEYVDWSDAPISPARLPDGAICRFKLPIAGAEITVVVWQVLRGPRNDLPARHRCCREPCVGARAVCSALRWGCRRSAAPVRSACRRSCRTAGKAPDRTGRMAPGGRTSGACDPRTASPSRAARRELHRGVRKRASVDCVQRACRRTDGEGFARACRGGPAPGVHLARAGAPACIGACTGAARNQSRGRVQWSGARCAYVRRRHGRRRRRPSGVVGFWTALRTARRAHWGRTGGRNNSMPRPAPRCSIFRTRRCGTCDSGSAAIS